MKNKLIAVFLCSLMFLSGGCGNNVSQKEYDATVEELQSVKENLKSSQNEISELETELENVNEKLANSQSDLESTEELLEQASEQIKELKSKNASDTTDTDNPTETQNEDAQSEDDNSSESSEVSNLFKEIYLPYAQREKPFIFEAVKTLAQNTEDYSVNVQEPTSEDSGTITFTDENGDYVFFSFAPNSAGVNMITILSYHQTATNSEVSLSNYSSDCTPEHDKLNTQIIGEEQNEVSSTDEQQAFLFGK